MDLEKKPTQEELAGYRHNTMQQIAQLVEGPRQLHLFDALHELGLPRALFLANLGDPSIREWFEVSKSRMLVNAPGELPDLETIRDRTAQGMAVAGLGEKLAVMIALADPTTEAGAEMLLKLAALQAKLLPKTSKVTTEDKSAEDAEIREEIRKMRAQREELAELHKQAVDANLEDEASD